MTHDSIGAHLSREVRSGAAGHVAAPESTSAIGPYTLILLEAYIGMVNWRLCGACRGKRMTVGLEDRVGSMMWKAGISKVLAPTCVS
jgi:hypothetical protein